MKLYLVLLASAGALAAVPGRTKFDPQFNSRIIGGQVAPEGAFPYQVSIRYRDYHTCGGAIIHPEWVVTAATCVLDRAEYSLSVIVGTNKLDGGIKRSVIAKYTHENYDGKTEQNNVAILRVQRIDFTNNVNLIPLETGNVEGNKESTLSGWGSTTSSYPPVYSDILQYINLKTTTVELCANAHESLYPITASQICTLTRSGEGSCAGDSGGPLVSTVNGTPKLIGIVSWTTSPCAVNKPDVYSKASSYYDWFRKKCNCI